MLTFLNDQGLGGSFLGETSRNVSLLRSNYSTQSQVCSVVNIRTFKTFLFLFCLQIFALLMTFVLVIFCLRLSTFFSIFSTPFSPGLLKMESSKNKIIQSNLRDGKTNSFDLISQFFCSYFFDNFLKPYKNILEY